MIRSPRSSTAKERTMLFVLLVTWSIKICSKKLLEEAEEFQDEPCREELADVLEVFYAILQAEGFSLDEVEKVRQKKAEERGAFNKKIVLEKVY